MGVNSSAEFIVISGVLIFVYLGIWYIGKYHDIQAATIQAARYAAWERTARPTSFTDSQIQNQARARVFQWDRKALTAADGIRNNGWTTETSMWRAHDDSKSLVDKPGDVTVTTASGALPGGAANAFSGILGTVTSLTGAISGGEALNKGGFYTSHVSVKIADVASLPAPLNSLNLTLHESSALAADSWDASGPQQAALRTRDFTLTIFLEFPSGRDLSRYRAGRSIGSRRVEAAGLFRRRKLLLKSFNMRPRALAALAAGTLLATSAAATGWQGAPESLRLESVGEEMRVNGTPMLVRHFEANQSADAVLEYMERDWSAAPSSAPIRHSTLGDWTILNQDIGDRHRSVQVRETSPGSIEGLLAVTSPALHREPVLSIRLPAGLSMVSVVDSIDQGRAAQQIMASSRQSSDNVGNGLESALRNAGWTTPQRRKTPNALLISTNRGDQELDAIITVNNGGSMAVINIVGGARP